MAGIVVSGVLIGMANAERRYDSTVFMVKIVALIAVLTNPGMFHVLMAAALIVLALTHGRARIVFALADRCKPQKMTSQGAPSTARKLPHFDGDGHYVRGR